MEKTMFLDSLFPNTSGSLLQETLLNNNNDLDATVEYLLSIENEERHELEPLPFETLLDMFPQTPLNEIHSIWLNNNGNLNACIDVLMDPSKEMNHLEKIIPPKHVRQLHEENAWMHHGEDSNKTQQRQDLLIQLCDIYPMHHESLLISALDATQNDLHKAASLIASTIGENSQINTKDSEWEANTNYLCQAFPQFSQSLLQEILKRYDHDMDRTLEYLLQNSSSSSTTHVMHCDGNCISTGFPCLYHSTTTHGYNSNSHKATSKLDWKTVQRYSSSSFTNASNTTNTINSSNTSNTINKSNSNKNKNTSASLIKNPRELRFKANELRDIRNEMYSKACTAYKRSDITGRSTAAYYSEEGRKLSLEIDRLDSEAAQCIISMHESNHDQATIDLHGLTVKESMEYLAKRIQEWSKSTSKRLKVITGIGKHSKNGSKLFPTMTRCTFFIIYYSSHFTYH